MDGRNEQFHVFKFLIILNFTDQCRLHAVDTFE